LKCSYQARFINHVFGNTRRLSNIFKTCITYFSSYFSQSLVSFIFFGVFFFVFVCFNFRWFLFFFKSYIYFLLFENSKIWIMLCSSKRQISNWITNVIISIDTRVQARFINHVFGNTKNNKNPGGHTLTAIHLHE
jgi:hypothetical protein